MTIDLGTTTFLEIQETDYTPGSTMGTARGVDEEGNTVTIGVDWRPLRDLAEAIEAWGSIEVEVYDWQILSSIPPVEEES